MNFYNYMIRNYKGTGSPEQDFANIIRMDKDRFPRNRACKLDAWGRLLKDYCLRHPDLYGDSRSTFDKCWKDYVACERERLNKNS